MINPQGIAFPAHTRARARTQSLTASGLRLAGRFGLHSIIQCSRRDQIGIVPWLGSQRRRRAVLLGEGAVVASTSSFVAVVEAPTSVRRTEVSER